MAARPNAERVHGAARSAGLVARARSADTGATHGDPPSGARRAGGSDQPTRAAAGHPAATRAGARPGSDLEPGSGAAHDVGLAGRDLWPRAALGNSLGHRGALPSRRRLDESDDGRAVRGESAGVRRQHERVARRRRATDAADERLAESHREQRERRSSTADGRVAESLAAARARAAIHRCEHRAGAHGPAGARAHAAAGSRAGADPSACHTAVSRGGR